MARNAGHHKIAHLLKIFFCCCSSVFVSVYTYLTCGPRRLFFFQCGPGTPQGRTALLSESVTCFYQFSFISLDTTCSAKNPAALVLSATTPASPADGFAHMRSASRGDTANPAERHRPWAKPCAVTLTERSPSRQRHRGPILTETPPAPRTPACDIRTSRTRQLD